MQPLANPLPQRRAAPDDRAAPGGGETERVVAAYPAVRLRRNRKAQWSRRLVAENTLSPADLIWPIFLVDRPQTRVPVEHMPGVDRVNIEEAVRDAELAAKVGIPAVA